MRKTVYFSERLDTDIIGYMSAHGFDKDFSLKIKELLRRGINSSVPNLTSRTSSVNMSHTPPKIRKVNVAEEDLESLLNLL